VPLNVYLCLSSLCNLFLLVIFIILDGVKLFGAVVLLLTRSANRSNQFATSIRPVWCVQEVRSVRLVVIIGQAGLYVAFCPFFILLSDIAYHMHHIYLYVTFHTYLHPTN
jgi:hypothetical protein